jgi:hypothetical protein
MDDIGIATMLLELDLHIAMIHDLFDILTEHGLHLKLSKSTFMQPQMNFLGICISKDGVTVDPAKIAGLKEWPRHLKNLREARGFLGVAGYHCMFILGFSKIAAPITKLTSKGVPFIWGPEQQEAQNRIIDLITNTPILARPDPSRQFELEVDASQIGTGAILYQQDLPITIKGKEKAGARRPIGFHSQKFTSAEQNYPIYDCEFLAIMHGLRAWAHLLKGTKILVLVFTNYANL